MPHNIFLHQLQALDQVCAKNMEMSWPSGDWLCMVCQHQNFKKRELCQRCGYPKFGGPDVSTYIYNRNEVLAGDWYCNALNCGAHNYASRSICRRCSALKGGYGDGSYNSNVIAGHGPDGSLLPPGWKAGDWICPRNGCGMHNYASRIECLKCGTPKDYGNII